MTQEAQTSKNFFRLNGGLNTEANEIGFPDGFTTDEANYELMPDGSRRRRKGLAAEASQGADKATQTFTATQRCQSFVWRNVGGNPNKDVVVYRQGPFLYFADADAVISNGWASETYTAVDMSDFETTGATTANTDDAPVTFTQGRGRLLVSGQYIKPFYVTYDSTNGYEATAIAIRIRDFGDVEDGTSVDNQPTDATIPAAHRYNLRNRGWSEDEITSYQSSQSAWPARNMIWHKGYKRTYGLNVAEADGQRSWDSTKMANEAFGGSSAPRGALFLEPFDSTFGYGTGGAGGSLVNISSWFYVDQGTYWEIYLTTDADHGLTSTDEFTIDGNSMRYRIEYKPGEYATVTNSLDGTRTANSNTNKAATISNVTKGATTQITTSSAHGYVNGNTVYIDNIVDNGPGGDLEAALNGKYFVITYIDTTNFSISENTSGLTNTYSSGGNLTQPRTLVFNWTEEPSNFDEWIDQYLALGTADGSLSLARSSGTAHDDSTSAVEWHAGRAFFAGMSNDEWADTIFYSQIVDSVEKFGKCYQEADPTDEYFNALVSTDGGTIVIPGMGGVSNLVSVRNSLIVLGKEGVWEVSGGQRGVFTADGYSVRKLSDAGCSSASGVVKIEDSLVFTGPGGVYIVSPNQYTGLLEVTNAIENTIQTLWNQVPTAQQERVEAFYDDALKKAYFMYGPDGTNDCYIDTMLIYDARIRAWTKYTFDDAQSNLGILTGFAVPEVDDPTNNQKAKFFYQASTTEVNVADFNQTTFDDVTGLTEQLPYMFTGWDNIGDFQRRRQAPVITVYSKRTETGYTASGDDWNAANPSSTKMTALWDWTDAKQWTSTSRTAQEDWDGTGNATKPSVSGKITDSQEVYRHVREFTPATANDVDGYPVVVTRNKIRGRGRVLQLKFEGAADKDSHILGFTVNYKVSNRK